jgi:hypothetical protein
MARRHRFVLPVALAAAFGAGAAAPWAAGATTTTTTADPAQQTAAQAAVSAAVTAANAQTSVHYVAVSSQGGKSITLTADVGTQTGQQSIVVRSGTSVGHVSALLVNNAAYFKGDKVGLAQYLGMPSSLTGKYQNTWIEFVPSDSTFGQIQQSFTVANAVSQIELSGPFVLTKTTCATGTCQSVRGLTTTLSTNGKKTSATLLISSGAAALPVRFQGNTAASTTVAKGAVDFSNWGEQVNPTAPDNAVRASTITGG